MDRTIEEAIASGDMTALRQLLHGDPTLVRNRDAKGLTPLHLAAAKGRVDLVSALLEAGADACAGDAYGYPPINRAAWDGHREVIELLIGRFDPHSAAAAALLTMLAGRGHHDCVELALARGVPVDVEDGLGGTPLVHALRNGQAEVAALLLDRGARVDLSPGGETPLALARAKGLQGLVERIEERAGKGTSPAPPPAPPHRFPSLASAAQRLKGTELITWARAKKLLRGRAALTDGDRSVSIHLWEGDRRRRGDLQLDAGEVLILTGRLVVEGALIDYYYNEDDSSQLVVLGDLKARTMITGSPVYVGGDLEVSETLYVNSFGMDTLSVAGVLRAGAIIDEGHDISCARIEAGRIFASKSQLPSWSEFPGAQPLRGEVLADQRLLRRGFVDPELLFRRATDGAPIVKADGARRSRVQR
jgi:hypothetical protein